MSAPAAEAVAGARPVGVGSPLRRLLRYMRRAPGRYVLGAALTLGYAAAFQLVPLAVRSVVLVLQRDPQAISGAALRLIAVAVVYAGLRFCSRLVMFGVGRQIESQIRNDYFEHLQRLPLSFYHRHRTGDLMSRAVNDINSVRLFLGMGLLNIIQTPVLYLAALVVMVSLDPWLTLLALAPFPLFLAVARAYSPRMFRANLLGQEELGRVSNAVQENASGVLVVRSYDLMERERDRFAVHNHNLAAAMKRVGVISTAMFSTVGLLPASAVALVLFGGGRAVQSGRLGPQDLWVFWTYIGMLTFPTLMLGFVLSITQRGLAALQRLGEVLDIEPSIRDREDTAAIAALRGEVVVRELSFTYPGAARPALDRVELRVPAGETLGIVGPVGSGKTTLGMVIPRLLEIPDGQVAIDGVDLNRIPLRLLRSSVAVVPQDSFLFSTSVRENIRFGKPAAGDQEVREAARRAHVLHDIEELASGLDTVVGERGITLSGGQRQRVALARALLLEPAILILDDALSSVDHETEERILTALEDKRAGRTCLIVAHRISAVQGADKIVVLDEGRVVERGTHVELIRGGGFYARLYRRQQLEAEIDEVV